eukprot:2470105-Rhodomonas_salina.1
MCASVRSASAGYAQDTRPAVSRHRFAAKSSAIPCGPGTHCTGKGDDFAVWAAPIRVCYAMS